MVLSSSTKISELKLRVLLQFESSTGSVKFHRAIEGFLNIITPVYLFVYNFFLYWFVCNLFSIVLNLGNLLSCLWWISQTHHLEQVSPEIVLVEFTVGGDCFCFNGKQQSFAKAPQLHKNVPQRICADHDTLYLGSCTTEQGLGLLFHRSCGDVYPCLPFRVVPL